MQKIFRAICVLVCLTVWVAVGSVSADSLDRIVALVNGDVILYSELQTRVNLIIKDSKDPKLSDPANRGQVEREVLRQMIAERLAEQEIKRLKITVSDKEVDDTINTIKKENNFTDAQFEYVVQQEGQTVAQFRQEIRRQLERSRLVDRVFKSKTIITDAQVDAYLKEGPKPTATGRELERLAVIFLPFAADATHKGTDQKAADQVLARLKKGEDFARVAKQVSRGPAVEEGGDIGYISKEELSPEIGAAVKAMKPGEISDVIKGAGGFYIVKLLDVKKEQISSSAGDSREKARRELMQQEVSRKFEEWIRDLEAKAFVENRL